MDSGFKTPPVKYRNDEMKAHPLIGAFSGTSDYSAALPSAKSVLHERRRLSK
ncbi:MAG: hypothetical protein AB2L11_01175 [Syntrophobacteraceae bacterium]